MVVRLNTSRLYQKDSTDSHEINEICIEKNASADAKEGAVDLNTDWDWYNYEEVKNAIAELHKPELIISLTKFVTKATYLKVIPASMVARAAGKLRVTPAVLQCALISLRAPKASMFTYESKATVAENTYRIRYMLGDTPVTDWFNGYLSYQKKQVKDCSITPIDFGTAVFRVGNKELKEWLSRIL
jgi:hypothetical protein